MNYSPNIATIAEPEINDSDRDSNNEMFLDDASELADKVQALLVATGSGEFEAGLEEVKALIKSLAVGLGITSEILEQEKQFWLAKGYRNILVPSDFEGCWQVFKAQA